MRCLFLKLETLMYLSSCLVVHRGPSTSLSILVRAGLCQDLSFVLFWFMSNAYYLQLYVRISVSLALVFPSDVSVFMFTLKFHSPSRPHVFDCFRV